MYPSIRKAFNVLKIIVLEPLKAGNEYAEVDSRTGQIRTKGQDGRISTLVIVANIAAFGFVLLVPHASHNGIQNAISKQTVEALLTSIVVAAACAIAAIWIVNRDLNTVQINTHTAWERQQRSCTVRFLWLFGVGCVSLSAFSIAADGECFGQDMVTGDNTLLSDVLYHSAQILFVLIQVCFMARFVTQKFQPSIGIHYALVLVLVANSTVWFRVFLNEAEDHHSEPNNATHWQNSNGTSCENKNTGLFQFVKGTRPYLYPMVIEYMLLAAELFLEIWSGTDKPNDVNNHIHDVNNHIHDVNNHSHDVTGSNPGSINTDTVNTGSVDTGSINSDSTPRSPTSPPIFKALALAVVVSVPFVICEIMTKTGSAGKLGSTFTEANGTIRFIHSLVKLLASWVGFYQLYKNGTAKTDALPLQPSEYILIFSSFGLTFYFNFLLIAAVSFMINGLPATDIKPPSALFLPNEIVCVINLFLQTMLMLQSRRYRVDAERSRHTMVNVLLFLAVNNFCMWSLNSFVVAPYSQTGLSRYYKQQSWASIMRTVYPLCIFYRFHSFLTFYGLYLMYSSHTNSGN